MEISMNGEKKKLGPFKLRSEFIWYGSNFIQYIVFVVITLIFVFGSLPSNIKLWSNLDEVREFDKEWHTEESRKFEVLGKLQEQATKDHSGHLWLYVKEVKTGKKSSIDVTPSVFMEYNKGGYVWFRMTKWELLSDAEKRKIDSPVSGLHSSIVGFGPVIYLFFLMLFFGAFESDIEFYTSDEDRYVKKVMGILNYYDIPSNKESEFYRREYKLWRRLADSLAIIPGFLVFGSWVNGIIFLCLR